MPFEIGLWNVDDSTPNRLKPSGVPLESQLEDYIEAEPALLGVPLLLIGRQVPTSHGTFIDLLGIDAEGGLHVLELKREKTPREVVAQVLDYGSWVASLDHPAVLDIYNQNKTSVAFEEAFAERFGSQPPEELNTAQTLSIVASDVDPATERIVLYLSKGFDVPVNVIFFRYFQDREHSYLARSWLVSDTDRPVKPRPNVEAWNGKDWYVAFGECDERDWDDARQFGFVSAGGGRFYSRTLRSLPVGGRVFTYIPQTGYVGVGTVTDEATRFDEAEVTYEGRTQRLRDLPLRGSYQHGDGLQTDEIAEYVVPVDWIATRSREDAVQRQGLFANQNSACKLRNKYTLDVLTREFDLDADGYEE